MSAFSADGKPDFDVRLADRSKDAERLRLFPRDRGLWGCIAPDIEANGVMAAVGFREEDNPPVNCKVAICGLLSVFEGSEVFQADDAGICTDWTSDIGGAEAGERARRSGSSEKRWE